MHRWADCLAALGKRLSYVSCTETPTTRSERRSAVRPLPPASRCRELSRVCALTCPTANEEKSDERRPAYLRRRVGARRRDGHRETSKRFSARKACIQRPHRCDRGGFDVHHQEDTRRAATDSTAAQPSSYTTHC